MADLYDTYVTVDFDIDFFKKITAEQGKCLELMCGTGRVSIPLLQQNVNLTCVDYSQSMLDELKKKAKALHLAPRIECQDICELDLNETYPLILIPFNSFSEITDSGKQKRAFFKIFQHLEKNGTFVCTLYNPDHRMQTVDGQLRILGKFKVDKGKSLVISYYNQLENKSGVVSGMQFYEIYDQQHQLIDKRYLEVSFSLITKDEFIDMAQETGFTIKEIYGDYDGSPFTNQSRFMNFVLTA